MEQQEYVVLRVNINKETAEALKELKGSTGCTITELVRRSVLIYHFIHKQRMKGREILLRSRNGKKIREILFN